MASSGSWAVPLTNAAPAGGSGGGGGWAIPNGGSGAAAPAQDNPVVSAQNQTQKYLNIIGQSGNKQAVKDAQQIASNGGHHSGSWLSDVVKTLDLPRAAVVSGVDTLKNGGGFSHWLKGTENHETTGQLLNELGVHNKILDTIGGIVGDVALDPLTYLGGLGELGRAAAATGHVVDAVSKASDAAHAAEIAAKTGDTLDAATAAQKAAEAAEATGNGTVSADTLTRLQTKGLAGLTPEERTFLEEAHPQLGTLQTGVGFRVPGSRFAGHPTRIPIVPGQVTDPITGALRGLTNKIADTKFMSGLEEKFIPKGALKNDIRAANLNGEGERAAALTQVGRMGHEAAGVTRQLVNTYGPQFTKAIEAVPKKVQHLIPAALEGDPKAVEEITAAKGDIGPLQNAYAELRSHAEQMGVPVGNIENYFPHQLTDAAREQFTKTGAGQASRKAFGSELQRSYKAGDQFLGHTLETGGVDEMNRIAHEVYGKDAFDLFRSDPRDVTANYLRGMAKRMGDQHFANRLDELGVTAKGDAALAPEDWASLGQSGADAGRQAPQYIKDALDKMRKEATNNGKATPAFLRFYDKALNVWKQYALAMPGKAIRHTVATPLWGMYLGNVGTSSMREAFKAWRAFQHGGIDAIKDQGMRDQIQSFLDQGLSHGHEFHMQDLTGPQTRTAKVNRINPLSTKHGYFRANQDFQRAAQDYSRFAMFHDAVKKGALAPEAAAKTRQFLGDPHNITSFERSSARRFVPFYTFLRQNMPVELKAVATQPGKFVNAYESPKQEVERLSPKQGIVPQYFEDTMSIRLPWQIGGNQVYLSPDLPFTRIGSLFSGRNQLESQTSPIFQDLIAYFNNANTFTGQPFSPYAKKAPGAWGPLPQILAALHVPGAVQAKKTSSDYGVTTPAGTWELTPKAESIIESLLPPLSQARRLLPTEANMRSRGDTTLLANAVGQNFRTNDPSQQAGELYRRQTALKALIEQLQNEGELPRYIYGFHA